MRNILTSLLSLSQSFSNNSMEITQLARYAVKGFSGDILASVKIDEGDRTFPDDRRYALLKLKEGAMDVEDSEKEFDPNNPSWLHKANFLCAFTEPDLMASFKSDYEIKYNEEGAPQRLFTLFDREEYNRSEDSNGIKPVLGPIDLNTDDGRGQLSRYFMTLKQEQDASDDPQKLFCATQSYSRKHTFQFGNTSSGVKNNNGDTRTVHIVNEATVRAVEDAVNNGVDESDRIKLNGMRFRPNIIVDGLEPWKEFDFIGKTLKVVKATAANLDNDHKQSTHMTLKVLSRTVRCEGIGIDPTDPERKKLNIPQLLSKHFPEHGPYLGVYAVIENAGDGIMSVGDYMNVVLDDT